MKEKFDMLEETLSGVLEEDPSKPAFEGSQKLSFRMLEEMGKTGVSKVEFNTLIYLAYSQRNDGKAYCNVHMLMGGIGISDSYFPGVLYRLRDKGLISFTRSGEWRSEKDGIYEVELPYNSFCGEFSDTPYIRLGHGIFRSQKFLDLTVAGKYFILMAMYELRCLSRSEIEKLGNAAVSINYLQVFKNCRDWASLSKRSVSEGSHRLREFYKNKFTRGFDSWTGKQTLALRLQFDKQDLAFTCSDTFSCYSNVMCAAFEEEGIHLSEMLSRQGAKDSAAKAIIRNEGHAKKKLSEAKAGYKTSRLIAYGQEVSRRGAGTKTEFEEIRKNAGALRHMAEAVLMPARKFGIPSNTGAVGRWDSRPVKSTLLKDKKTAFWFRYTVAEAISAFRWIGQVASHKHMDVTDIDMDRTLGEFLNMLILGKTGSFGLVLKKICPLAQAA